MKKELNKIQIKFISNKQKEKEVQVVQIIIQTIWKSLKIFKNSG